MGEKLDFNQNHRIIGAISTLLSIIRYHVTISDSLVRLKMVVKELESWYLHGMNTYFL